MSGFSILTNTGAQVALANLGGINSRLGSVQKKISTGQQVADATDNAAVFAVAQGIRANLQSYNAVNTGLNDAQALVQTTLAAVTSISNILPAITASLTRLADGSINDQQRQTYTANLRNQVDEVQAYINGANYNGANLLNDQTSIDYLGGGDRIFYSSPENNITVLAGPSGSLLTINSADLEGVAQVDYYQGEGSYPFAQNGFLGYLVGLAYYVGNNEENGSYYDLLATQPAIISGSTYAQASYQGFDEQPHNGPYITNDVYVSRNFVYSNQAIAALAAPSLAGSVYVFSTPYGTFYSPSVFDGSLSNFTNQVDSALSALGATANNIQLQLTFNQSIANSLNTGLGNLVDADLAQASAQLTALQTQQQLAVQTLSIANAQPQAILSLFK